MLDSEREDPSPASEPALRRQTSAVGAVCSNPASTDLCGGRRVNWRPYRDKRLLKPPWERSKEFLLAKSQQKERVHVASRLKMTTQKSFVAVGTPVNPAPPAQIRTCRITAYGSYRRCLASKRRFGCG